MSEKQGNNMTPARILYGDIIDLPHWQSPSHPRMSLYDRSAQFAPFAALTGYDDMITEEARLTGIRKAQNLKLLNAKLAVIQDAIDAGTHPSLHFSIFVPDEKKDGGEYIDLRGTVKKIDLLSRTLVLYAENEKSDGILIDIANLQDICGDLVDYLDDEIL